MLDKKQTEKLKKFAVQIRIGAIEEFKARGFGHVGGSLSIADVLAVLYGQVMNVDPAQPAKPDRDKLVCSKGHAGPAVYAALALKGYFPYEDLKTLNQPKTNLPSHCDRKKTPGVDMTTGSLGQGTSLAAGMALGDKLKGRKNKVFLIVGDGESNEGQVWEAAMFTAAKKLTNLVWLIDYNKKQLDGALDEIIKPFSFEEKMKSFGFDAVTVKGNDIEKMYDILKVPRKNNEKPLFVILDTIKGQGVEYIEKMKNSHHLRLTDELKREIEKAIKDLESEVE